MVTVLDNTDLEHPSRDTLFAQVYASFLLLLLRSPMKAGTHWEGAADSLQIPAQAGLFIRGWAALLTRPFMQTPLCYPEPGLRAMYPVS